MSEEKKTTIVAILDVIEGMKDGEKFDINSLSAAVGKNKTSIRRAVEDALEAGICKILRPGGPGRGNLTVYVATKKVGA